MKMGKTKEEMIGYEETGRRGKEVEGGVTSIG